MAIRDAARYGNRRGLPYAGDYLRANVSGTVCPAIGQCFAMIFDVVFFPVPRGLYPAAQPEVFQ